MGLLLLLSHRLPDWPTSYFWPARQPRKSEWRFETWDNSTQFSKLFLIMVVSISKFPSAHNSLMFLCFLKKVCRFAKKIGCCIQVSKNKTSRQNCRKLMAAGCTERPFHTCGWPVLFNSTSNKTSCPTLGDPSLVDMN